MTRRDLHHQQAAYPPTEALRQVYWLAREEGKTPEEAWEEAEQVYRAAVKVHGEAPPARAEDAHLAADLHRLHEADRAARGGMDAWIAYRAVQAAQEAFGEAQTSRSSLEEKNPPRIAPGEAERPIRDRKDLA